MTLRPSGHISTFGLVFFVFKSLLGIARQWSREKFAILTPRHRSQVRILIYRTPLFRCLVLDLRLADFRTCVIFCLGGIGSGCFSTAGLSPTSKFAGTNLYTSEAMSRYSNLKYLAPEHNTKTPIAACFSKVPVTFWVKIVPRASLLENPGDEVVFGSQIKYTNQNFQTKTAGPS